MANQEFYLLAQAAALAAAAYIGTCWGANALMAAASGPIPFMVVVGPTILVYPKPLLEATKEFYRNAFPSAGVTKALDIVVDAASLELGNAGDLKQSSMVHLTYEALVGALWTKCAPDVIRRTALDMAVTFHAPGKPIDLSQLHYSKALVCRGQVNSDTPIGKIRRPIDRPRWGSGSRASSAVA